MPFQTYNGKGKAKGKGKDYGKGDGKIKGKGMFKGQGKGMGALEQPYEQEPQWQDDGWGSQDGGWNLIGAVSKMKPAINIKEKGAKIRQRTTQVKNRYEALHEEGEPGIEDNPIKVNMKLIGICMLLFAEFT